MMRSVFQSIIVNGFISHNDRVEYKHRTLLQGNCPLRHKNRTCDISDFLIWLEIIGRNTCYIYHSVLARDFDVLTRDFDVRCPSGLMIS